LKNEISLLNLAKSYAELQLRSWTIPFPPAFEICELVNLMSSCMGCCLHFAPFYFALVGACVAAGALRILAGVAYSVDVPSV